MSQSFNFIPKTVFQLKSTVYLVIEHDKKKKMLLNYTSMSTKYLIKKLINVKHK